MAKFADYGFNKSHAAAYALVAYQTAWMKANHPEVFIAACMSLALGNTDRLAALREEAAAFGHPHPAARHQPLRRRLHGRAHGGRQAGDPLRAGRGEEGRVCRDAGAGRGARRHGRSPISPISPPASIRASSTACSWRTWSAPAPSMHWKRTARGCSPAAETILRRAQAAAEEKEAARSPCSAAPAGGRRRCACPICPTGRRLERLDFEAEAIGFHLTAHPLDAYAQALRRLGATPCDAGRERCAQAGVTRVQLAGTVVAQKERVTRTGNRMAWVRITDASGSCEVTLFAEVLARSRELLANGIERAGHRRICGRTARRCASPRRTWSSLDQAAASAGAAMRIWLRETAAVPHIRDLLGREGRGKGRVDPGAAAGARRASRSRCRAASMSRRGWRRR